MKSYRIGTHDIHVYEMRDARPRDAAAAVANAATICFVERVADASGALDDRAMSEAIARHCRLKVTPPGHFELCFDQPAPVDPLSFWSWRRAWRLPRHDAATPLTIPTFSETA